MLWIVGLALLFFFPPAGIAILILAFFASIGSSSNSAPKPKTSYPRSPPPPPPAELPCPQPIPPSATKPSSTSGVPSGESSTGEKAKITKRQIKKDPNRAKFLEQDELTIRMLRPLREKGKLGKTHTTPIENVYSKGIPPHQIGRCREMAEGFIKSGMLAEKVSQGRRHVWLTNYGLKELERALTLSPHLNQGPTSASTGQRYSSGARNMST